MGLIHISFAYPFQNFGKGMLWFIGSGIAIILAGFINLLHAYLNERKSKIISIVTNGSFAILFCFAVTVLNEIQVYFGIILFASAMIINLAKIKG